MLIDISYVRILFTMTKSKNKIRSQKNKNNKTKPENLMKKQYLESYEELKKSSRQTMGQSLISSIVGATHMSSDGRVVAKTPAAKALGSPSVTPDCMSFPAEDKASGTSRKSNKLKSPSAGAAAGTSSFGVSGVGVSSLAQPTIIKDMMVNKIIISFFIYSPLISCLNVIRKISGLYALIFREFAKSAN